MEISFKGKYKSLRGFSSEPLTDFTVITGKNGSGKTQLITAIHTQFADKNQRPQQEFTIEFKPHLNKIHVNQLLSPNIANASMDVVSKKIDIYNSRFESLAPITKHFYSRFYDNNIPLSQIDKMHISDLEKLDFGPDIRKTILDVLQQFRVSNVGVLPDEDILNRLRNIVRQDFVLFDVLLLIKTYKQKEFAHIVKNDFITTPLPEEYIDTKDLFESHIETIFFSYLKRRSGNELEMFRKTTYGDRNNSIKDNEFESLFPAPWTIINKILGNIGIDLRVKEYASKDYAAEMTIDVRFIKVGTQEYVSFNDLSTGEQVIIGLIIKLFTKDYYKGDLQIPELIVLDEPDAFLHPEMSKLLIDVLYKSFVKDLGIKVIMSTHSPSTVALAPEDSIYEMKNNPESSLKSISKDEALNLLTGDLPTLSIDYKNHRQIFVESPTDVGYFQKLYNKMGTVETMAHKLYFISNEKGKGNNDWVIQIVNNLRASGVGKAFGIIDWDLKNKSSESIFVHGEQERYSIENYLLDAIYLVILFLEMGVESIRKELNIEETYVQYDLSKESQGHLQEIWNWLIARILKEYPSFKANKVLTVKYENGKEVSVPDWYLQSKGHLIEEKLKKIFPQLASFRNEGELQNELSIIMAKCYPLVPIESVSMVKKLARK